VVGLEREGERDGSGTPGGQLLNDGGTGSLNDLGGLLGGMIGGQGGLGGLFGGVENRT
jgi:hypothetical protein